VPPVGYVSPADGRARERFRTLLLVDNPQLEAGWQLAQQIGRTATPLLWDMLKDEKPSQQRRLALLMAIAQAGGPAEDDRILEYLEQIGKNDDSVAERVLACLWMALGPDRARPVSKYWPRVLPRRSPHQVLRIATNLAAARLGAAADAPRVLPEDDTGILASAAFAGIAVPESAAGLLMNPSAGDRHADLFRRGALLGALRGGALEESGDRARVLASLRPFDADGQPDPLRQVVALVRGRAQDARADGPQPPWHLLVLLAADPGSASQLQPWLRPEPSSLADDQPTLAVEYAFAHEPAIVVRDRGVWGEKPTVRHHVAVALALQLLRRRERLAVDATLPGVPEWFFVRWAGGGPARKDATIDDPELERAALLAEAGRLPLEAARTVLEEALWRWRSHPGRGLFDAERLLVRDLLLTGSHAGKEFRPSVAVERCYFATGIDQTDEFFRIAIRAFKFLGSPTPPIPPACRLR
jgi:hypothetical protein